MYEVPLDDHVLFCVLPSPCLNKFLHSKRRLSRVECQHGQLNPSLILKTKANWMVEKKA